MNDKIKAISQVLCGIDVMCKRCGIKPHCEITHEKATFIYTTHVKPLEDALTKASKESAMNCARAGNEKERVARTHGRINAITIALRQVVTCDHDKPALEMLEVERDTLRRKLAKTEEREKLLVGALVECVPVLEAADEFFSGVSEALTKARVALARVKREVC